MTALVVIAAKYLFIVAPLSLVLVLVRISPAQRRTLLYRGVVVLLLSVALAKIGGALYDEPRPFVVRHETPLFAHEADNGFPSDHTLLSFACAFLALPFSVPAAGIAALVGCVVGFARVASLVHSPLDIVASIVFAAVANAVAYYAIGRRPTPS